MQADAYARARTLLDGHRGQVFTARVLGIVHSVLVIALLLVLGLLAGLIASQGVARYPAERVQKDLDPGDSGIVTGRDRADAVFDNTGIFPIVTGNLRSNNPIHRVGARLLQGVTRLATLRNNVGALATLLAFALLLLLLLCLIAQYRRSIAADVSTQAATSLRKQLHRQMYRLGQSSLPTEGTGPVVNLITREVNDVRDGLFSDLLYAYRTPVLFAGLLLTSMAISWVLTLFLASLGVLVWLIARRIHSESRVVGDGAMRDAAVQLTLLHEDVALLRTVRVYGMENIDKQRFDEHVERFREADARRIKTEARLSPTTWLLYGASVGLALGLLGYSVVGSHSISPASLLVIGTALVGLSYPILTWLRMRKSIRQANRSANAIFDFLERKPELHQQGGAQFLPPMKKKISLENVTLESHPALDSGPGRTLLEGVSLEFPFGSRSAIMSLEEDAKLALVCLIPRLIDPKVGRVRIDGHDLRDVTLESVRAQVATVLQNDLVFTDSVTMNIGLGDPSYSVPRIVEAAKVAHAHSFIQDLPHGYDTVIGPLGHYLKPDEQYRIALARAFLHDPSIVIIEEPTSPMDEDVKHLVDDTLARLSSGRTLIILPHRLSTIRSCQQIVLLHNGKLETVGNPTKLQSESKLFRHIQYLEFNQFATGELEAGQMNG